MPDALSTSDQPTGQHGATSLDRLVGIVRRNLKLLLVCLLLVPAVALIYSLTQESRYTASATLLFRDPGLDEKLFGASLFNQDDDPQRAAATNLQLVGLRQIAERTATRLASTGLSADDVAETVSVSPVGESDLIDVEAVDPSPPLAARLANTFAEEYIAFRRDADRSKVREAQQLVQEELDSLSATERLGANARQLEQQERDLEVLASLQTGNAELVQPAQTPTSASSPKTARNVVLGILLGLLLGVGLTFLREQLDRRLKDADEAVGIFGLPVLATIPENRSMGRIGLSAEPKTADVESDAFRMLRTNLRYFNVDRQVRSIVVTSAEPQDGKTTVSWNLSLAEARANKRVLYLEADLRRPSLGKQLGQPTASGLSLVLSGISKVEDAIQTIQGVDVLFAGPLPPNPAELIESERMRDLIRWGEANYDRVVIDTPPAAIVADAIPLVGMVSGVVIVVRIRRSRRDSAQRLREQLSNLGAPLLGLVVNGVTGRSNYYYGPPGVERVFDNSSTRTPRRSEARGDQKQRPASSGTGQQPGRKPQQTQRSKQSS